MAPWPGGHYLIDEQRHEEVEAARAALVTQCDQVHAPVTIDVGSIGAKERCTYLAFRPKGTIPATGKCPGRTNTAVQVNPIKQDVHIAVAIEV
jgi:hypothetical protein